MPLPRVCVLCAISGLGGAEFSLLELVTRLRDSYEFHLIVPGEGPLKERAESAGAKVWILPWPEAITSTGETATHAGVTKILHAAASLQPFTRRLSDLLEEIQPSVFVTNAVKAHIIGALARKPKNVPLIWYMRDGLEERILSRKLLALLSRRCDMAVCISEYVAAQFREYVSESVPTQVVYNIVDLNRFHPEALPPADLRKGPDEVWFGMVGAITPLKGHDIFLGAAERVLDQQPNTFFVIVGNNPYLTEAGLRYEELLRRRMATSLVDRVKFVGFRNDVPNVLSQLDVLVQPNRGPEGLGRSVLEAMACGVPVIAVDKWGPAELIEHGRSGLLFPPRDAEKLATHMLTLARSKPLRKAMGKHGHAWIQQNLISKKLAGQFDGILACAIASPQ
ncbi:MAG TPA: glycosyltransferase family 4 protein [Candidatus Limnocylindrales bacterium]|nr:glycosyltransferase family 4 protein [Candidatus Limnocylindrales bacterium]